MQRQDDTRDRDDAVAIIDLPTSQHKPSAIDDAEPLKSLPQVIRDALPKGISFRSVPPALRVVVALALALLCLSAIVLVSSTLPQPQLGVAGTGDGRIVQVPVATVILVFGLLILGGALALAGALRLSLGPRLLILTVATLILGFLPFAEFQIVYSVLPQGFDAAVAYEAVARVGQLLLLAMLWIWAIGIPLLRRLHGRLPADAQQHGWHLPTFLRLLALVGAYYALEFSILVVYLVAGYSTIGYQTASFVVSFQLENLPLLLGAVAYYAVTGLTDVAFSLVAVTAAVSRVLWRPWLVPAAVAFAGLAIGFDVLHSDGPAVLPAVPVALVFLALAWALTRASGLGARWPEKIPPAAVAVGAAVLFFQVDVSSLIAAQLRTTHGLTPTATLLIDDALGVAVGLVAVAVGLLLLLARSAAATSTRPIGFFLALVGVLSLALRLPSLFTNAGLFPLPPISLDSLRLLAAITAVFIVVWMLARPAMRERPAAALRPLTITFLALAGLQALQWTIAALVGADALQRVPLMAALLFLVSLTWDLLSSGDVTERNGSAPRDARVMVHFGSVLLGAATLLYTATRTYQGTGAPVDVSSINRAAIGLFGLGVPLLLYGTARRLSALTQRQSDTITGAVPVAAASFAPWAVRLTIASGGVVTIGLVAALTAAALPAASVHPVAGSYTAATPGPCDTGGARWSEPSQTHSACQSAGLVLYGPGYVDFQPRDGRWPRNYNVSVHMTFVGDDCAGIVLRANNDSGFEHTLCSDGSSHLLHTTGLPDLSPVGSATAPVALPLALGLGRTALNGGVLQTVADGAEQRLLLDGQQVASAPDSPDDATILIRLLAQTADTNATVTLSDFSFTPLPDTPPGPIVNVTPTAAATAAATAAVTPSITPNTTPNTTPSASATPSVTPSARTPTPSPIATASALPTATATATLTATAAPSPTPSPYQPYFTHTPGPNCDPGTATWFVGSGMSVTCLAGTGLRYNIPAATSSQGVTDDVLFTPPENVFPSNYRVSAHFDVSAMPEGCMSLSLRETSTGGYLTIVCTDGSWTIVKGFTTLAGAITPSLANLSAYTVQAEANGTAISLAVNGTSLSTVHDSGPTTTHAVDVETDNVNNQPASPVVSDFTYTPLP